MASREPLQRRRILIVEGNTLAKLLLGPKGIDAIFVGDAEVWITDLAEIDAELNVGVEGRGPDICRWIDESRERVNLRLTATGTDYRKAEEDWRLADLPDGFRPEWSPVADAYRLLDVQASVEALKCDWLVVVTDDEDIRAWLRHAEPRVGICGARVFERSGAWSFEKEANRPEL